MLAGVVVVVAAVALLLAASASLANSSRRIHVTSVDFTSSDDVCGLAGASVPGFTTVSDEAYPYSVEITNNGSSCAITQVAATTLGFDVTGPNTPLSIPSFTTEYLNFTIHVPSGSYSGNLTIEID